MLMVWYCQQLMEKFYVLATLKQFLLRGNAFGKFISCAKGHMMSKIVGVAVRYNGTVFSLPSPNRHHHVLRMIGGIYGPHEEGFVLDDGTYVGRIGAMQLAKDNGQLNRRKGVNYYQGPELYSEDLW